MQITVRSFEDMQQAANKLKELSESYTEIYTQLLQEANTMGSAWDGADNLAFVEQINGFTEELKAMADKVRTFAEIIEKEKQNYVGNQEHNIREVKKFAN